MYCFEQGLLISRHQYVRGEERESVYETPYGDLHMDVNTHELTVDFHEGVGHVHLGYDISVEGEWQFYNQLDIDVREDTEHGNEGILKSGIEQALQDTINSGGLPAREYPEIVLEVPPSKRIR